MCIGDSSFDDSEVHGQWYVWYLFLQHLQKVTEDVVFLCNSLSVVVLQVLLYLLWRFRSHNHLLFSSHDKCNNQQPHECSLMSNGKYMLGYLNAWYERINNLQLVISVPEKVFWQIEVHRNWRTLNRALTLPIFLFASNDLSTFLAKSFYGCIC